MKDPVEANRIAWDARTSAHVSSRFYDLPAFIRGVSSLKHLERQLCGVVAGRSLLHLQCHFGLDTLSWARLGATTTGVDFSGVAIASARELAERLGIPSQFIEANVCNLPAFLYGKFDLVVTTYGVLCWLSDLESWAAGISASLKPGGRFILIEFHPLLDVILDGPISHSRHYFGGAMTEIHATTTYADRSFRNERIEYFWQHSLSEVISALLNAGLRIDSFAEYPFCPYPLVDGLHEGTDGYWYPDPAAPSIPYLYSLVASK